MERLTAYERARVEGTRATQIANGSSCKIKPEKYGLIDPMDIAQKELELGRLPMIVVRELPNGKTEEIRLFQSRKKK